MTATQKFENNYRTLEKDISQCLIEFTTIGFIQINDRQPVSKNCN